MFEQLVEFLKLIRARITPLLWLKRIWRDAAEVLRRKADRAETGAEIRKGLADTRALQTACSHNRPFGDSHCVQVHGEWRDFILCQKCQLKCYPNLPEDQRLDRTPNAYYDTVLYNKMHEGLLTREELSALSQHLFPPEEELTQAQEDWVNSIPPQELGKLSFEEYETKLKEIKESK
jgi:hypothetical protein